MANKIPNFSIHHLCSLVDAPTRTRPAYYLLNYQAPKWHISLGAYRGYGAKQSNSHPTIASYSPLRLDSSVLGSVDLIPHHRLRFSSRPSSRDLITNIISLSWFWVKGLLKLRSFERTWRRFFESRKQRGLEGSNRSIDAQLAPSFQALAQQQQRTSHFAHDVSHPYLRFKSRCVPVLYVRRRWKEFDSIFGLAGCRLARVLFVGLEWTGMGWTKVPSSLIRR